MQAIISSNLVNDICSLLAEKFPSGNIYNKPLIQVVIKLTTCIKFLHKIFWLCLLPETIKLTDKLPDNAVILQTHMPNRITGVSVHSTQLVT